MRVMQYLRFRGSWRTKAMYGLTILVALSPRARAGSNSVPDWVKAAAQTTLPELPSSTNAVVLLDDTTYTVAPDGRAVEHVRRVVKILRPKGRETATPRGDVRQGFQGAVTARLGDRPRRS